jgi:REP element-mobilizing transposase RayT
MALEGYVAAKYHTEILALEIMPDPVHVLGRPGPSVRDSSARQKSQKGFVAHFAARVFAH